MATRLGTFLKEQRGHLRISLRQFAIKIGIDPAFYSRIERGEVAPPGDSILAKIAEGLGISVTSGEFDHMRTLVDVDRGRWPADLASDDQLAGLLPAFYAKLRSEPPTDAETMYHIYRDLARGPRDDDKD